jgi:hypothetical protein
VKDRKVKQVLYRGGYLQEVGDGMRKEGRKANMVDIFCVTV